MSEDLPTGQAGESARGLVLRVISPRVIAGAGIAVGSTMLTAEYVDAAGESHPVEVRPAAHPDGESQQTGDGAAAEGEVVGSESVTVSSQTTGQSVSSTLETTIGPGGDGASSAITSTETTSTDTTSTETTDQGQESGAGSDGAPGSSGDPGDSDAGDSGDGDSGPSGEHGEHGPGADGGPGPLGDDILVEFVQHIVVHDLPNGQYLVESVITIVVHRDGQREVFEDRQQKTVTKEHADTDLVIQQDADVVIRLDDEGNVTVAIDGELTVTEQPGDPNDNIPEDAVVVIQEQELTVIDEDDGILDDVEDADVYGNFEQTASAVDDPGDGEEDVFVINQSQTKTEVEVDTTPPGPFTPSWREPGYGTTTRAPTYESAAAPKAPVGGSHAPTAPAAAAPPGPALVTQATAESYVASAGLDPAFGATPGGLPDGVLDAPLTPVARGALGPEPAPETAPTTPPAPDATTSGHFEPEPPSTGATDGPAPTEPNQTELEELPATRPFDGQQGAGEVPGSDAEPSGTEPSDASEMFGDPTPTASGGQQVDSNESTLDPAQL
ncbi:MAG: hypothetical protein GEU98_29175 [Pseudonocardiaceae bacterium]|nr:hypothetical protein [Pseudonocardiaceae bacterium]